MWRVKAVTANDYTVVTDNGAPFGDNGACCVHCGAFEGVEYEGAV